MLTLVAALIQVASARQVLIELGKKYSVEIQVASGDFAWQGDGYKVEGHAPPADELERYVALFASEWNRYPREVIPATKLKRIVIASNISLDSQARAAVPAFDGQTMFYDTTLGRANPLYQRSVIHHEFFHYIDNLQGHMRVDPEWAALNPIGFRYGSGGDKMRVKGAGSLTDNLPGLLTPYAGSGVEEDKAELFSHLLTTPEYVERRMASDPVLCSKVALLKGRLVKWNGAFDEAFWASRALVPAIR
ncbi:MAG: hypothetical protein ABUL72_00490 [Armatimonadota bacterium]